MPHPVALTGLLLLLGPGCGEPELTLDTSPAPAPTQPPPPPGLTHEGETLFSLDTTQRESAAVVHGAPEGARLLGVLTDQGGRRALVLRIGNDEHRIAEPGWHLPPVGAWAGEDGLICWNTLTGPESQPGAMPHPSQGLSLQCRTVGPRLGEPFSASPTDAPAWLVDVAPEGGGWAITAYVNRAGWLFGEAQEGDGLVRRVYRDGAFGPAEPLPPPPPAAP